MAWSILNGLEIAPFEPEFSTKAKRKFDPIPIDLFKDVPPSVLNCSSIQTQIEKRIFGGYYIGTIQIDCPLTSKQNKEVSP